MYTSSGMTFRLVHHIGVLEKIVLGSLEIGGKIEVQ